MVPSCWGALAQVPCGFWDGFTWLGDSALLLPASLLILMWLALARRTWPTAWIWVLTFGVGSFVIVVSKIAFLGWGIGSARFNFTGFSGHTAIAASVWPVALWLVTLHAAPRVRVAAVLAGWLMAAAIGVSRLAILAHSESEVASGLLLGMAVSASFLWVAHRRQLPRLWWPVVVLSFLMPMLFQEPGKPAPTQGLLEHIAITLAGIERPYTREDLLKRG